MPTAKPTPAAAEFSAFALPATLLRALADVGYESPSPIQVETIPALLAGRDLVGQAQTGTGKTAAFALPILARLNLSQGGPQALVLTPTRELAIQVAEAFQRYAAHLRGFHVLPIYGGQGYGPQLAGLRRGPHVVIGTPGRVIDHLERGTLSLAKLATLVLDEGDEMLRMGFIEDVEAVLAKSPPDRQVALFSATMPAQVRRIAQTHLRDPIEITIRSKTATAANTRQRYLMVSGVHKLDVLTRILEVEPFDAMIVFARTKVATDDLAQRLAARGFAAAPLNGDLAQAQRERTILRLKKGEVDILVATDVAARGLDVDRISHVLNFDIPADVESYVHRIGRTGRAGRSGEAILFVTHRERHLLQAIERATRQSIEPMAAPTVTDVNQRRIARFKEKISTALAAPDLDTFRQVVEQYAEERDVPAIEIAAALAKLAQGKTPLLDPVAPHETGPRRETGPRHDPRTERSRSTPPRATKGQAPEPRVPPAGRTEAPRRSDPAREVPSLAEAPRRQDTARGEKRTERRTERRAEAGDIEMVRYRVAVGRNHGVKTGNLVGAIANEAGLDSEFIGRIDIRDDHSFVDLPVGMPRELVRHMRKVWVAGQQLRLAAVEDAGAPADRDQRRSRRGPEGPGPIRARKTPAPPPVPTAPHSNPAKSRKTPPVAGSKHRHGASSPLKKKDRSRRNV